MRIWRWVAALWLVIPAVSAIAQESSWSESFDVAAAGTSPAGWIESAPGTFTITRDPLVPLNRVYTAKHETPKQRSVGRDGPTEVPSGGAFSVLATRSFSAVNGFVLRGRFLRDDDSSMFGVSFFSSQPESNSYRMLALWRGSGEREPSLRLYRSDGGELTSTASTAIGTEPAVWYRFALRAESAGEAVRVRARVWRDGTAEPDSWEIDVVDSTPFRNRGRIALWSAVGSTSFDDLTVLADEDDVPDSAAPAIQFFESGEPIPAGGAKAFGRDARVDIRAIDGSGVRLLEAWIDDQTYTPLDPISSEARHRVRARAVDLRGNAGEAEIEVVVDKTPPVIAITNDGQPLPSGLITNASIAPHYSISDLTETTVVATIDTTPFVAGQVVDSEGAHALAVTATDVVGWSSTATVAFAIDRTPPQITFTSPAAEERLGTNRVVVIGTTDDAVRIVVNGVDPVLDAVAKTFRADVELLEGPNTIIVHAWDLPGNRGDAALRVHVDTAAPRLTLTEPLAGACVALREVTIRGTAEGATGVRLRRNDDQPIDASLQDGAWSAVVPLAEGATTIVIEARDEFGHISRALLPLDVDWTAPVLTATERGAALAALYARAVLPAVHVDDADSRTTVTVTLNGAPHEAGTVIETDGRYVLVAKAVDCAGNSTTLEQTFTVDRTPPSIVAIAPANGAEVGTMPVALTGTLSEPATVTDAATGTAAIVDRRAFTLRLPFEEGLNERSLLLVDEAGNRTVADYALRIDTTAPAIEIVENGTAIQDGALFNRAVTPIVRVSDAQAVTTVDLNGRSFVSGTTLELDGTFTLTAKAIDPQGHSSAIATARFSIDRTPPKIEITTPLDDETIAADSIEVTGTVDADAARVVLNGLPVTVGAGRFSSRVLLTDGPNALIATAVDAAGNVGSDTVSITRRRERLALLLTAPADGSLTNRPTAIVAGQVVTPSRVGSVTINGSSVPVDLSGAFTVLAHPLEEGVNEITARVSAANGEQNELTVRVTADFTPPLLEVTANGLPLESGARFSASPMLGVEAHDERGSGASVEVFLDGAPVDVPISTSLADGGHALTAIATDAAGNETRVDRAFVVGDSGGSEGCAISDVDPPAGTAVRDEIVRITGRCGGARGVLIDGNAVPVVDGSFCGDARLAVGRNEVLIRCANGDGTPTDDPGTSIILWRDDVPSIAITSPIDGFVATPNLVEVRGTVSDDIVSGDVNGVAFEVPRDGPRTFRVAGIPLSSGLNVITARGRSGSGAVSVASTRATLLAGTPQLTITSPLPNTETGAASIEVRGTYTNVDPNSIRIGARIAAADALSETSGRFSAVVSLVAAGTQTIAVTGRNALGAEAEAEVEVVQRPGAPSIAITTPQDSSYLAAEQTAVPVTGTFNAEPGSQVAVNGVAATIEGTTFRAEVLLSGSGATPLIARVTTPSGEVAIGGARVIRLASEPAIRETYPASGAATVDRGAAVVLLFNNPLDAASARAAFRLSDTAGNVVSGTAYVDRESLTFAPKEPLRAGETYTATVSVALRDLAGSSLPAEFVLPFTTIAAAPRTAPLLDEISDGGCAPELTLTGRASTPGATIEVLAEGIRRETTATATGAFQIRLGFSGRPGFHVIRVREKASDGTVSPERAVCVRFTCEPPTVIGASLDRATRSLRIEFSRPMKASTLVVGASGTIVVTPDGGAPIGGEVSLNASGRTADITLDSDLGAETVTVVVTTAVTDAKGAPLASDYTQTFAPDSQTTMRGNGWISGGVVDATTGRPLENAVVTIGDSVVTTTGRGRYAQSVAEGARTIHVSAPGYTSGWRRVVVGAGAAVVPIDVRLTRRGTRVVAASESLVLRDGGETAVTRPVELSIPAGTVLPGHSVRLTAIGAQALPGLLPLGWSPVVAAEVIVDELEDLANLSGASLTFVADASAVIASTQTLSVVEYRSAEDEWRVIESVATVSPDGRVTVQLERSGAFALVYPDAAPHLEHPPLPHEGDALRGVSNPCVAGGAACALVSSRFDIEPRAIVPNGRAVATLVVEGSPQIYPSGTAAQAFVDEELHLADGRVLLDPAFSTDVLLYRTLAGDEAVADFHVAPTATAAAVLLHSGVEHVRIVEYPGRVDRGNVIAAAGGRVAGAGGVTIEILPGSVTEPLQAMSSAMTADELSAHGSIAGFRTAAGFSLALDLASSAGEELAAVHLMLPARVTIAVPDAALDATSRQVVIVEVLPKTKYGVAYRLAAICYAIGEVTGHQLFATRSIDSAALPLDGVRATGQYLVLVAESPIAYAFGVVVHATGGAGMDGARVIAASAPALPLGVTSISSLAGVFVLPVPAAPAAPFSLTAESPEVGRGASVSSSSVPSPDAAVDFGELILEAQPPHLLRVSPDDVEVAIDAPFEVRAEFDAAIDPSSVSSGIEVTNLTTGAAMSGSVAAAGPFVTFTPGEPLRAASDYAITIAGSIRGINGAPFAQLATASFRTSARPSGNAAFHPERIRITIPDEKGRSTIRAAAGALPAGNQAVAVRRGRFFVQQYQATVANDGSFAFDAGYADARDRIDVDDTIDLHVLDAVSHAVVAVIELTPFTSEDGHRFIARHDRDTHFVNADGITVDVPVGAFDRPTLVEVKPAAAGELSGVPGSASELTWATGLRLEFDGVARKRLNVTLPVPAHVDTTKGNWLLGYIGESVRGPRVMIVDLLAVQDGAFTTAVPSGATGARTAVAQSQFTSSDVRGLLLGVNRSGAFAAVDLHLGGGPMMWGIVDGLQASYDLFWNTAESLYAAHFYLAERRGRVAIPVPADRAFEVVGVDAASGLESFSKVYDPIPAGDAGGVVSIENPDPARMGPYPVFATPFRVEVLDVQSADQTLSSVRDFTFRLSGDELRAETTLPAGIDVTLMNPARGAIDRMRADGLSVAAEIGDRIVVLVDQRNVDPSTALSIVFSEALEVSSDSELKSLFRLQIARPGSVSFEDVTESTNVRLDSGGRRVVFHTGSLVRGARYRIAVSPLVHNASRLQLGQGRDADGAVTGGAGNEPLYLSLEVRKPAGRIGTFELSEGVVRDQALNGNVLLISAGEGGILAYDTSNPAALNADAETGEQPAPLGRVASPAVDYWSIASDHHGRVYATGVTSLFGMVQSYRLEDFVPCLGVEGPCSETGREDTHPHGAAIVSYVPGAGASMQTGARLIAGDRAEAFPRRIQILLQDDDVTYDSREEFKTLTGATVTSTSGDFEELSVAFDLQQTRYAVQRYTIENVTLDLRWSADATAGAPARIAGIVARPGDRLRLLRNQFTYGVVTLFGYGIGLYDLNAMESNDADVKPDGYHELLEQIRLTNAEFGSWCESPPPERIPNLTFAPDAALVTSTSSGPGIGVYAVDAQRGLLDLALTPPTDDDRTAAGDRILSCSERAPVGLVFRNTYEGSDGAFAEYDHPRLRKLREKFESAANRRPLARYAAAARYHWRLEAADNPVVTPATDGQPSLGSRGSVPNQAVDRDYLLVPGNEYGLLVVEVPKQGWLGVQHLADVIWIPAGAYAVRVMAGTTLATVVDGRGHILLVDLARIDERWDSSGPIAADALFPTASAALDGAVDAHGVGYDDPRILWRSSEPLAALDTIRDANGNVVDVIVGTLAPVVDPDTGFIFAGKVLTRTANVVSASDPRIQLKMDFGAGVLSPAGGVVPLGIAPPDSKPSILHCDPATTPGCNASLSAFRLEITLPGAIGESLTSSGKRLLFAVESERVSGAPAEQTPDAFPRAHLRQATRSGVADPRADARFAFERVVPQQYAARLRHLRGFNKFVSPWIVALADLRASERYVWPSQSDRAGEGCFNCERPPHLKSKAEADGVWELYTNGRLIAVRPDLCNTTPDCAGNLFAGTPYAYLGDGRLTARFATVMADTVRPPSVLVAARNPPIADGALQETTYLHSGELEASTVDVVAGGRADWNVMLDRTYRSRSIGTTPLGFGWDSMIFRRLRPLPNGNVEYRDGAGEVWLYRLDAASGSYVRPRGLFLNLARSERGWLMTDRAKRFSAFDDLGRLILETDEFVTSPYAAGSGNVIRYLYNTEGQLVQIIDPAGRSSHLAYFGDADGALRAGRLRSFTAWGDRRVEFLYDQDGRLVSVDKPVVENADGVRPRVRYAYATTGDQYNDRIELSANLEQIFEPAAQKPRVSFSYGFGADRDRVVRQGWSATGESATFAYDEGSAATTDVYGQRRQYRLTAPARDEHSDRVHVSELEEQQVETAAFAFGLLPAGVSPMPSRREQNRRYTFAYHEEGMVTRATLAGDAPVSTTTNEYRAVPAGWVIASTTTSPSSTASGAFVSQSVAPAITRKFEYVDGAFVAAMSTESNGEVRTARYPVVHGRRLKDAAGNDSVRRTVERDAFGRPKSIVSEGGTDPEKGGSAASFAYADDLAAAEIGRGELTEVREGTLRRTTTYETRAIKSKDERGVETTTSLDAALRPVHTFTSSPESLRVDETTTYDARGRVRSTKRLQDGLTVTTSYTYDELGRVLETRTDNVAIGTALDYEITKREYDLPGRKVITTLPGGAIVTEHLDSLGRVRSKVTETGSSDIRAEYAYDIAGNLVYTADNHTASATAYDVHGRVTGALAPDGTRTMFELDPIGNAKTVRTLGAEGETVAESTATFTDAGRLTSSSTRVDADRVRTTETAWDGAGRTTAGATGNRAWQQQFDESGALVRSAAGEGTVAGVDPGKRYVDTEITDHDGLLPAKTKTLERSGPAVEAAYERDALANVTAQSVGSLRWEQEHDQAGNVLEYRPPARGHEKYEYDARGRVRAETRLGAAPATIEHGYSAAGAPVSYEDPVGERTNAEQSDRIGRPLLVRYPDDTFETFTWDGPRLRSRTDRQRRTYVYDYDAAGRIREVRDESGAVLEQREYDSAGRPHAQRTAEAELVFDQYDMEGRPRLTRQTRYADHSGFGSRTVRDAYEQTHTWNVHGERRAWTMPRAVHVAPAEQPGWTTRVEETHDAEGNVDSIMRSMAGGTLQALMTSKFRGEGRPLERSMSTSGGASLVRRYEYDESDGRLDEMIASVDGVVIAGSTIEHDGLQIGTETLHGVSDGQRVNRYTYDDFGRLQSSDIAREKTTAAPAFERLNAADFREALVRPQGEPRPLPSLEFEHAPGHKIARMTRDGETREFKYDGAERVDDGRFTYRFDRRGRLVAATEKAREGSLTLRRILYEYSPADRIVGRRAEYAVLRPPATVPDDSDWKIEDRAEIIVSDALPADTTFVWDPVTDRLVTIADRDANPLRQMIHGDQAYDDPIEVAVKNDRGGVDRLYPLYDEAGAGLLQAIVNDAGEIISRTVIEGPYGEDEFTLTGPAVDHIGASATRTADGKLETVSITIRLTEAIAPETVATGARLATLDSTGATVQTAPVEPTLDGEYTIRWTLTGAEWQSLLGSDSATTFSIAVTNTLRAFAWSDTIAVLARPDWSNLHSSPATPVEYRESIAVAATWFTTTAPATLDLFTAPAISALGYAAAVTNNSSASAFQALPFAERLTGLTYARARWMDPGTGVFITPDPIGYQDSSNLSAYAGADPVNGQDPTGTITIVVHGTFAANESWWNNGRFAASIDQEAGDVWKIKTAENRDVSQIPELRTFARGRFAWSGGNTANDRLSAAQELADYINTIKRLYPAEPINVVTHSHGGNVATAATSEKLVQRPASIDSLVLIAKPYFTCAQDVRINEAGTGVVPCRGTDPYEPDFKRIRRPILSTYSNEDRVQTSLAEFKNGENVFVSAARWSTNPTHVRAFVNVRIPTFVGPIKAHGVQHSARMGRAIGRYIALAGASSSDWIKSGQETGLFEDWLYQTSHWVTPSPKGANVGVYIGWEMGQ